jgi:hypothetical protein
MSTLPPVTTVSHCYFKITNCWYSGHKLEEIERNGILKCYTITCLEKLQKIIKGTSWNFVVFLNLSRKCKLLPHPSLPFHDSQWLTFQLFRIQRVQALILTTVTNIVNKKNVSKMTINYLKTGVEQTPKTLCTLNIQCITRSHKPLHQHKKLIKCHYIT